MRHAPRVDHGVYMERVAKGRCIRCGSDGHQKAQCSYLPPLNPLGLTGTGEDQTREMVLGKVGMPSRYWFLHEPSPTRNTKSVGVQVTTSSASGLTAETPIERPAETEDLRNESPTAEHDYVGTTASTEMNSSAESRDVGKSMEQSTEEAAPSRKRKTDLEEETTGSKCLAISNLSEKIDDECLRREFEEFGEISAARVVLERDSGRSKGYGYIDFVNSADAAKALAAKKGALIDGREANIKAFSTRRSALNVSRMASVGLMEMPTKVFSGRIHIIGTHELGKLAAHSLASLKGRPPITLLMHSEELIRKWRAEGETIVLVKDDKADARIGFDIERTSLTRAEHAQTSLLGTTRGVTDDSPWLIKQLIVADHGWNTLPALLAIRDRLTSDSTILFLQKLEGVMDRVDEMVFQNPATRPQYIRAHSTHGLMNHPQRTFAVKHYKQGQILLAHTGEMNISDLKKSHPSTFDLIDIFERSHALFGVPKPMQVLLYHKLQRLAVDSVLGPLSVVFDCKILDLRYNYMVSQNLQEMLKEICAVIQKMPELKALRPNAMKHFTVDYLEKTAAETCNQLQQDAVHPMAKLVAKGSRTDIQFTNGYFIEQGKKLGVPMPVNLSIMRLVKAKQAMNQKRLQDWIPFDKNRPSK